MQSDHEHPRTHLFLLRLWVEPLTDDQSEVRMQVKHLLGGATRYFRTWPDVEAFLLAQLEELEAVSRRGEGDHGKIRNFRG